MSGPGKSKTICRDHNVWSRQIKKKLAGPQRLVPANQKQFGGTTTSGPGKLKQFSETATSIPTISSLIAG